jgi:chemotaxis protein MotB
MRAAFALVGLVSFGFAVACGPSQEDLDAERAKVRDLQEELRQAQSQREELEGRLAAISAQNQEMIDRLRALGENVEELEGERAGLQSSLTETQRALAELRERERQAQARLQIFRQMLEQLRSLIDAGTLTVRVRHGRMVVVLPEGVLFDSGRAQLKDEGEATLTQLGQVLSRIENRQFQVMGHTDNVPIRSRRFPSNWELSASRAVNVARFLIAQGMTASRLSAAGYAETQPAATNDTEEGRAQNRRIEIAIVFNVDELPNLSALDDQS